VHGDALVFDQEDGIDPKAEGAIDVIVFVGEFDTDIGESRFECIECSADGFKQNLGFSCEVESCSGEVREAVVKERLVEFIELGWPCDASESRVKEVLNVSPDTFTYNLESFGVGPGKFRFLVGLRIDESIEDGGFGGGCLSATGAHALS
jgi:hypothetical protein